MHIPAVSVIVPCFKRVDQTLATLRLLLASTGNAKEFSMEIIVADCSPDKVLHDAVTETFGDSVCYTRTEKTGLATNKNQGASLAKHPLLIFCDSDVEVEPDTIRNTIAALKNNPRAGGVGPTVLWKDGPKDGQQDRPEAKDRKIIVDNREYIEILYGRYFGTYKAIWEELGGYEEVVFNLLGESSDMSTRYWRGGYPLIHDDTIRVHHCQGAPDSLATRVPHPEYTITRNWLLLIERFLMYDGDYSHFSASVREYYERFGDVSYLVPLRGAAKYSDDIQKSREYLQQHPLSKPVYPFTFLDVFTDQERATDCIQTAEERLANMRKKAFPLH